MHMLNNKPTFSIIVPAYNAETYIHECISSVEGQICMDWELILVDDGSTDSTADIIDCFVNQDIRIKGIHKVNGGEYSSRKAGILVATGEWLVFLDADDKFPVEYLKNVKDKVDNSDSDILIWGFQKFGEISDEGNNLKLPIDGNADELLTYVLETAQFSMCNKAFKRELFDDIEDIIVPPSRYSEDSLMSINAICKANKYSLVPNNYYLYRIHGGSVSFSINSKKMLYLYDNVRFHRQTLEKYGKWSDQNKKYTYRYLLQYTCDYVYTLLKNRIDSNDVYEEIKKAEIYSECKEYEKISLIGLKSWIILKAFRIGII